VVELLTDNALHGLLDAGRLVVSELDVEAVLGRVLDTAADITGARYAALGVLDEDRTHLERFITHGASPESRRAIGHPPRGHGVLGAVIRDPRPIRIDALAEDPRADGFPPGHPPMRSFLGVPILIRGAAWGNLYLCDKAGDEPFSEGDEAAVVVLAQWAAVAIDNARLYERSEARVRRLEATTAIARALGGETDLDRILELIADHGQALTRARGLLILLRQADGLVVAACAGESPPGIRGRRLAGAGDALSLCAGDGVVVPLVFRGQSLGMIVALG
jgi:GAF domain-containing protein